MKVVDASELVPGRVVTGHLYSGGEWVAEYEDGQIINNPTVAKRLLPTQSGFFFGGTDYDAWYFEDVKQTMTVLEAELARPDAKDAHYEYWSSW
jgi:hypothetical protein